MKKKLFIITLLSLLLLASCSFGEVKKESTDRTENRLFITPTPPGTVKDDGINTSLKESDNEMLKLFVSSYYSALRSGSTDQLSLLVTDPDSIGEEVFERWEGVGSVSVKHRYTLQAESPIDYVAYVYYEIGIDGTARTIPSLDELYISEDNGNYRLISGTVSASAYNSALAAVRDNAEVNELVSSVNLLFEKAIREDETIKDFAENRKRSAET